MAQIMGTREQLRQCVDVDLYLGPAVYDSSMGKPHLHRVTNEVMACPRETREWGGKRERMSAQLPHSAAAEQVQSTRLV